MGCLKCLKVSTIPLAFVLFLFYIIALSSHYWTTCDKWNYNNGLWKKCVNDHCERLYEPNVQYRYRDSRCNGKANSYYTTDTSCRYYYRCLNGVYDYYNCSAGQFNVISEKCENTAPSGCTDLRCVGKINNRYYRTDTMCKNYYKCHNNAYTTGTCASNEYFSLSSGTCTTTKQSGCQDPKCIGKANGWYITDSPTCKKYYVCNNGFLTDNQQCSFSSRVANPTTKTCSNTAISTCKDPRCYNKADKYYVKSNLCTAWYRCNGGYYTEGACPSQEYFDVSNGNNACTSTRPASCVDYRCQAHGMNNGDNVIDNTCREYYTCRNGAYTRTACPTGPPQQYYNRNSNVCGTTVPSGCRDPRCINKADGWYITDSPTCRSYYVCYSSGMILANRKCNNVQVANPTTKTCTSVAISTCKDPRCYNKGDGYYRIDSWCKSYYRCNNGYYTSGTCSAGRYFDTSSNTCVNSKPTSCYDERCATRGANGGYRVTDSSCKSWSRCASGAYTSDTCPNNQQFSIGRSICVTSTPAGCKDSRCDGKGNGYYVKDNVCRNYYRCNNGIYTETSCSSSWVFIISSDIQSGNCRSYTTSGSTNCKDPRCTSSPNSNGWRNKDGAMCRQYYVCNNGYYTDRECPVYQYWDDSGKTCSSTLPSGCRDQRCYGKFNGKYRVDRNCIDYYQCTAAKLVSTGQCTGGTRFQQNTGTCVSANSRPVGCKVDGGYGHWTLWGACSVTTGFGIKTRTRRCNNPTPAYSGNNCDPLGPHTETYVCWACPTDDWMSSVRGLFCMATVGSFLALFWAVLMNCSKSRHPIGTGGALFLLALVAGMAGLIVYHSNIEDFPGCSAENGWSMVLGWIGVILSAAGFIISIIAMYQSEARVSSTDGMQMRTKTT